MKRFLYLPALLCMFFSGLAFAGSGEYAFRFLEIPASAPIAASGGYNAALAQAGINGAVSNPSLLGETTDKDLALNFSKYISDVNMGSVAFGKNWNKHLFGVAIQYVDYGTFDGTDETNQSTGTFTAKDYALSLMYAKALSERWQAGLAFKPIYSAYESYTSFGLGVDLGVSYIDKENGICSGLTLSNIGQQITGYTENETAQIPFNSVVSFSKKFKHAPIRVSVSAHHLHQWDLSYTNTITKSTLTGEEEADDISFLDMLFRHAVLGIELVPTNFLYVSVSYNHQRGRELDLDGVKTISGFSFGGGIKVSKFNLGFAASQYQKGIMTYQFSLSTNLNAFKL